MRFYKKLNKPQEVGLMGKNKESAKGSACFSLIPKLKTKSSHKKAVMARETFTSTNKAATNYSPELVLVVSLLAKEQSTAVRKCFNLLNNNAGQEPSESNIKSWGFDSSESRNIRKIAKGIYDSQHELHESNYIPDIKSDIRSLQKRIKSTKSKLSKAKSRAKKYKLKKRLFNLQNKLNKTKQRLSKLQASFNQSKYSVCFGTKDLQRKFTRNLNSAKNNNKSIDINNAYQSYLVNKAKWDSKRNSEFFFEGHANQKAGNQKVKLIERSDGLFDLNIHIPKRLQPEVAKIVNLKSGVASFEAINFGSGRNYQDLLIALTPIVSIEHTKTGKTKNRQSTKYPISHRLKLVMDSNGTMGVDVISTIKIDKASIVSNRNNGSLGVDVNQHSVLLDYSRPFR